MSGRQKSVLVYVDAEGMDGPKLMGQATTTIFKGLVAKFTAARLHQPIPSLDFGAIGHIVMLLIGLYLISALFGYIQQYIMAGVAQTSMYDLRQDVDRKLARLPLKFFDARTHGEILSRVQHFIRFAVVSSLCGAGRRDFFE